MNGYVKVGRGVRRWSRSDDAYILKNCNSPSDYMKVARALSRSAVVVLLRHKELCGTINDFKEQFLNTPRFESKLFTSSFRVESAEKQINVLAKRILDYCLLDCASCRVKVEVKISSI